MVHVKTCEMTSDIPRPTSKEFLQKARPDRGPRVHKKNTQWKFGTRKGFLKRPERGNDRNNEEFVKCRCKMPCSLPSSLTRRQNLVNSPRRTGAIFKERRRRSVGRPMGRVAQRREEGGVKTVRKTQNERPSRLRRPTVRPNVRRVRRPFPRVSSPPPILRLITARQQIRAGLSRLEILSLLSGVEIACKEGKLHLRCNFHYRRPESVLRSDFVRFFSFK